MKTPIRIIEIDLSVLDHSVGNPMLILCFSGL